MTGANGAKKRKLTPYDDKAQDSGEAAPAELQDTAEAGPAAQPTAVTNGNGSHLQHSFHAYTSFNAENARMYPEWSLPEPVAVPRPVSADSARLFPEWSVPEPVAVPYSVNGMWGPAWLQQQEAAAQQPQQSMQLVSAQQHKLPVTAALHAQPQSIHLDQQAGSQPRTEDAGQHEIGQQAAQQQPHNIQHVSVLEAAPAAATQSADTLVQPQQQHPSVSHLSLAPPSTSEPADVKQLPSSAQLPAERPHVLAQTVAQQPVTVVQASMPLELLQQQHQQLAQQLEQQQPEQQLHLRQQQEQGQRPLPEAPSGIDDLSSSKVEHGHQQPGTPGLLDAAPGPPDAAPMTVGPNVGAYSQRELFLQNLEQAGEMSFEYVLNDGQRHNSIWLIALKNIFSKQLPNMPREYIARLVLDRRHRSVAIVRRRRNVVGGITYRPFHQQRFGEIAFCAVTANEQVKGFGTRLMNFTKEYAKTQDQLTHFLTYADNNAVGYFAKQGFTKEISLDKEWWVGYIKDYDGGTLMECVIVQRLPHTRLPAMIQAQKQALDSRIRQYSRSHVVHDGLSAFQEGHRRVEIGSIPGVKEAGWDPGDPSGTGVHLVMNNSILDATPNNLQHFMLMVVHQVQQQEDAWPFLHAVTVEEVPDYHDIIKDPMDLGLMEQRLKKKDYYLTLDIFAADMRRIFNNARVYNASDSAYYKWANKLEAFFDQYMHAHLLFGQ
ncbi:TPA: hypothetical protein ACH3X3_001341 [Trebouxia sp. C0006]